MYPQNVCSYKNRSLVNQNTSEPHLKKIVLCFCNLYHSIHHSNLSNFLTSFLIAIFILINITLEYAFVLKNIKFKLPKHISQNPYSLLEKKKTYTYAIARNKKALE